MPKVKVKVNTEVSGNTVKLVSTISSACESRTEIEYFTKKIKYLTKKLIDLEYASVRKALVGLGWNPPGKDNSGPSEYAKNMETDSDELRGELEKNCWSCVHSEEGSIVKPGGGIGTNVLFCRKKAVRVPAGWASWDRCFEPVIKQCQHCVNAKKEYRSLDSSRFFSEVKHECPDGIRHCIAKNRLVPAGWEGCMDGFELDDNANGRCQEQPSAGYVHIGCADFSKGMRGYSYKDNDSDTDQICVDLVKQNREMQRKLQKRDEEILLCNKEIKALEIHNDELRGEVDRLEVQLKAMIEALASRE